MPGLDLTGVLTPALKRDLDDPVLWRRLHDEHVGLLMLWQDKTVGCWFAYALYPWIVGEDDQPHWAPDYDLRATLMQAGATPQAAVLGLFDDPRRHSKSGFGRSLMHLGAEISLLIKAIRRD